MEHAGALMGYKGRSFVQARFGRVAQRPRMRRARSAAVWEGIDNGRAGGAKSTVQGNESRNKWGGWVWNGMP